jgi:AcrR family transcriptional regulator
MNDTGWRGSADVWLDAAFEALLEGGVDAVRIQPLGKRIKLSRTSFYWFFRDREELLAALVERWKAKNTPAIVQRSGAYAESVAEAVLNVTDCWLDRDLFDSQFEFAIRSWALQSADVAREVEAADGARLAALTGLFVRFGYDAGLADVRARAMYLVQIGYISMNTREDMAVRMKRIPDYVDVFTGHRPEPKEIQRFQARHRFVPDTTAEVNAR